jgi:hypothetical protein
MKQGKAGIIAFFPALRFILCGRLAKYNFRFLKLEVDFYRNSISIVD